MGLSKSKKRGTFKGDAFEKYVMHRLAQSGFLRVTHTGKSGDFGADIICYDRQLRKIVIQCKYYSRPVGISSVQEVNAARQYYNAVRAVVVTNSTFTASAKKLAASCRVELEEKFH